MSDRKRYGERNNEAGGYDDSQNYDFNSRKNRYDNPERSQFNNERSRSASPPPHHT